MYTLEDLKNLSGSKLSDEVLQTLYDSALTDLRAWCKVYGLAFDAESDVQTASFKDFFDVLLFTCYRMDGKMDITTLYYAHHTDLGRAIEDTKNRALARLKAEAELKGDTPWIVIT